jgi:lantibiotic modifying enzyme
MLESPMSDATTSTNTCAVGATRPWRPLLADAQATQAHAAIRSIATDLAELGDRFDSDPSLASGAAGAALFYAYLAQVDDNPLWEQLALERLEQAIAATARWQLAPGLYGGLAGVAWTLAHLSPPDDRVDDEQFSMVDEALLPFVADRSDELEYDLIHGLAGIGTYAMQRLPSSVARRNLEHIVGYLEQSAVRMPRGVAWRTPAARLQPGEHELFLNGQFNLGVAHGVPGVIGLLTQAVNAGVAAPRSNRLLEDAVTWLLDQRRPAGAATSFGYFAGEALDRPSRLAWCYGDLGIAAVLLSAAEVSGNGGWRRAAIEVACSAAQRTLADSGVHDAGLCHGAAGVAHLFNRLHQASGEPELAAAAHRWYVEALAFRSSDQGVGGFRAWLANPSTGGEWADEPGFLEGAAGIGLALLAAVTPIEPKWDCLLGGSMHTAANALSCESA